MEIIVGEQKNFETSSSSIGDFSGKNAAVEGRSFIETLEAKTSGLAEWPHGIQYHAPASLTAQEGDVILAESWIQDPLNQVVRLSTHFSSEAPSISFIFIRYGDETRDMMITHSKKPLSVKVAVNR